MLSKIFKPYKLTLIPLLALLLALLPAHSADSPFLSEKEINGDGKTLLMVFTKDDCYSCRILETSLTENAAIQGFLILNFAPYLINIDDKSRYAAPHLGLVGVTPPDLARLYGLNALPAMVFVDMESREILRVVGFPGEKRIIRLLEFIHNDLWKQFDTTKERVEAFLNYEKANS